MALVGDGLAILLVAAVLAAGYATWRRPFLGVGFLVAGMAFHNVVLMALLRLGTSSLLVRTFQLWKEGLIGLLVVIVLLRLRHVYVERRPLRLIALDWVAIAFLVVMVVYALLPNEVLGSHATLQQRLAAFRIVALIPLLYGLGRVIQPHSGRDLATVIWMIVGAGAVVGAFGLIELFFIPTRSWLDLGVNQFSAWLGFHYSGPRGLPENYFQTLAPGIFLRRMVSTYISPLGIAYTGLLVFPMAVVLVEPQPVRWRRALAAIALALVVIAILFSVTRLAMLALVGEAVLMATFIRRPWLSVFTALVFVAVLAVVFGYPRVGPVVDVNLNPAALPSGGGVVSAGDPSLLEHIKSVAADLKVAITHPLGAGLGISGTSAVRYGGTASEDYAPGESAILSMFVDTGVLGGLLFLALYGLGLVFAARGLVRVPLQRLACALPMVAVVGGLALIPVALTSDVWGDLSVTFLFWWAVGYSATFALKPVSVRASDLAAARRPQVAS